MCRQCQWMFRINFGLLNMQTEEKNPISKGYAAVFLGVCFFLMCTLKHLEEGESWMCWVLQF